jgi:hypothetical protein
MGWLCHRCLADHLVWHSRSAAFFKRFRGQPKTDLILIKLFENGVVIAGALATAWAGFGLRLVLIAYRHGIV